jgi:hypothetical protein
MVRALTQRNQAILEPGRYKVIFWLQSTWMLINHVLYKDSFNCFDQLTSPRKRKLCLAAISLACFEPEGTSITQEFVWNSSSRDAKHPEIRQVRKQKLNKDILTIITAQFRSSAIIYGTCNTPYTHSVADPISPWAIFGDIIRYSMVYGLTFDILKSSRSQVCKLPSQSRQIKHVNLLHKMS